MIIIGHMPQLFTSSVTVVRVCGKYTITAAYRENVTIKNYRSILKLMSSQNLSAYLSNSDRKYTNMSDTGSHVISVCSAVLVCTAGWQY